MNKNVPLLKSVINLINDNLTCSYVLQNGDRLHISNSVQELQDNTKVRCIRIAYYRKVIDSVDGNDTTDYLEVNTQFFPRTEFEKASKVFVERLESNDPSVTSLEGYSLQEIKHKVKLKTYDFAICLEGTTLHTIKVDAPNTASAMAKFAIFYPDFLN